MPYREKIAWLYLAAMAVTYGPYFLITALHPPGDALPNLHQFWRFAVTAGAAFIFMLLKLASPESVVAGT